MLAVFTFIIFWLIVPGIMLAAILLTFLISMLILKDKTKAPARAGYWAGLIIFVLYVLSQIPSIRGPNFNSPLLQFGWIEAAIMGVSLVAGFFFVRIVRLLIRTEFVGLCMLILSAGSSIAFFTYFFEINEREPVLFSMLGFALGFLAQITLYPSSLKIVYLINHSKRPEAIYKNARSNEISPNIAQTNSDITITFRDSSLLNLGVNSSLAIRIHILEEPLTVQNLSTVITSLTELGTKCWLITEGRFADLIEYTQTRSSHFSEEANFIITDITHNSPFSFDMSLNPESAAKALQVAIDALSLRELRENEAELANQARKLEMKLRDQEAVSIWEDKEQARQIEAQKAELEKQKSLIEIEKQQLDLERQRFELQVSRINYALETANKMIDLLHPDIDAATKAMISQSLLPSLLQLGTSRGLELAPSGPQNNGEKTQTTGNK